MMTIKSKVELVRVPIKSLSVMWAQAQRPFNEKWAKQIAEEFDPDKFDPPVITRPNGVGQYHIVEGQHRVGGAKIAFGESEQLLCRMVDCEDPARAAEIWLGINAGRKAIKPIHAFEVSVAAGREPQTEISAIVKKMEYRISGYKGERCISAVSSLIWVHNKFGVAILKAVLLVLDKTWSGDPAAFAGDLIRGYASFINEFHSYLEPKRLSDVIAKAFTPNKLLAAGRLYSDQNTVSAVEGIAETLRAKYNYKLREEKARLKRK
jgi:hypothetical protein